MRLRQPISAELNTETKHLIINGENSLGKKSTVEIPYVDDHVFLMWLIAVFQEPYKTAGGGGRVLMTNHVTLGMHEHAGKHALSFNFANEDLRMSFAIPIETSSPERLSAIQAHLEQALKEMGQSGAVVRQ